MHITQPKNLWGATLVLACLSALVSACDAHQASAATVARPAPAHAPAPSSASTGAVQRIEPIALGFRVVVRLDNGETRTFEPTQIDGLRVGDRVRVEQGHLRRV